MNPQDLLRQLLSIEGSAERQAFLQALAADVDVHEVEARLRETWAQYVAGIAFRKSNGASPQMLFAESCRKTTS